MAGVPEYRPKAVRSFVIRTGRMTNSQKSAYDLHWASYGLELDAGMIDPQHLFGRSAPVAVEIGFGMGDSLFQMCVSQPDQDFIGIEVHSPGAGRLMNLAAEAGLRNLKIYLADASDVLRECIPAASIDRFQIYFPDPWPKKKHHKRRLIQPKFIESLTPALKAGGLLHMATDWQAYAEHMQEVMDSDNCYANKSADGGIGDRPHWRPETRFEQRGLCLGHGVWDFLYERVK